MIPLGPEVLVYFAIIIGIVLLFFVMAGSTLKVMPYLYANTRISYRSKNLIGKNKFKALIDIKNLKDFIQSISDSGYLVNHKDRIDISSVHDTIQNSHLHEIEQIISMSPKALSKVLVSYKCFFEAKILKQIYRAKKKGDQLSLDKLPSFGIFSPRFNDRLIQATIPDLKVIMAYTIYSKIFSEDYENILDFEKALDNFVMSRFNKTVNSLKLYDKKANISLLKMYIESQEMLILIKSIIRGEDLKERMDIASGLSLPIANDLAESETLDTFVAKTKNTIYYKPLSKALGKHYTDQGLYHFSAALYASIRKFIEDNELMHYQGPFQILSYLLKKEIEKTNLYAISKGIESGFSQEQVMGMVA